jgi:aspartyl-tRNA(Asn)/glutamyl-tRNA(Gln) amidotransferase subunit B
VLVEMFKTGKGARQVIEEQGLVQVSDASEIERVVTEVIASNPKQLEQYRAGKETLFGFFVGQVMKASQGKANPKVVNEVLKEKLRES